MCLNNRAEVTSVQMEVIQLTIRRIAPNMPLKACAFSRDSGSQDFHGELDDGSIIKAHIKDPLENPRIVELTFYRKTGEGDECDSHDYKYPFYIDDGRVIVSEWHELSEIGQYQMESGLKWPNGKRPYSIFVGAVIAVISFFTVVTSLEFIESFFQTPKKYLGLEDFLLSGSFAVVATLVAVKAVMVYKQKLTLKKWRKYSQGIFLGDNKD